MREFSILVFPYAKLRRCSSFSCGVGTFFLASSRSSCRRSVINSPLAQGFYGHGSEEEQGCGIPPFERRERWGTRLGDEEVDGVYHRILRKKDCDSLAA